MLKTISACLVLLGLSACDRHGDGEGRPNNPEADVELGTFGRSTDDGMLSFRAVAVMNTKHPKFPEFTLHRRLVLDEVGDVIMKATRNCPDETLVREDSQVLLSRVLAQAVNEWAGGTESLVIRVRFLDWKKPEEWAIDLGTASRALGSGGMSFRAVAVLNTNHPRFPELIARTNRRLFEEVHDLIIKATNQMPEESLLGDGGQQQLSAILVKALNEWAGGNSNLVTRLRLVDWKEPKK